MSGDRPAGRPLLRQLREFAVIAVGVFTALAAESWWSEREDRQYERELREDMVAEFVSNLAILDADIADNEVARERIGMLESLEYETLEALPDQHLAATLGPYLSWAGFDPEMGSVQALVESGNLGVIGDRDLRLRLARWAGLLEQRRRFNLQAVQFQHQQVLPTIARVGADGTWSAEERRLVQGLLHQLLSLHDIVVRNQRDLREAARDILDYLERNP